MSKNASASVSPSKSFPFHPPEATPSKSFPVRPQGVLATPIPDGGGGGGRMMAFEGVEFDADRREPKIVDLLNKTTPTKFLRVKK